MLPVSEDLVQTKAVCVCAGGVVTAYKTHNAHNHTNTTEYMGEGKWGMKHPCGHGGEGALHRGLRGNDASVQEMFVHRLPKDSHAPVD